VGKPCHKAPMVIFFNRGSGSVGKGTEGGGRLGRTLKEEEGGPGWRATWREGGGGPAPAGHARGGYGRRSTRCCC
jgi:hypothetical protein